MTSAATLRLDGSGAGRVNGPNAHLPDAANSTLSANHTARLAMTPTTAAVIAASPADSHLTERSRSICGAPAKIHRKHGAKVKNSATDPPSTPA
jgi:hypothetical protein